MKKILSIILGLAIGLNSFGQEPGHDIKFVFVDSVGNIITPDIWVKSKTINQNKLKLDESKQYHLIIDSLSKFQNGPVTLFAKSYTIYPIIQGHWLDIEYNIKLILDEQIMNINFITNGTSFRDTIEFRNGNFIYLHKNLNYNEAYKISITDFKAFGITKGESQLTKRAELIELDANEDNFCALNCAGIIKNIDPDIERIMLTTNSYYRNFLIVNNLPIGVINWNQKHLFVCYFSDNFIEILKNYYY